MDIMITVNVLSGDGLDYHSITSRMEVEASSQAGAILAGLQACQAAGIDDGLVEGVRLDMGNEEEILDREQLVYGGVETLAELIRKARTKETTVAFG